MMQFHNFARSPKRGTRIFYLFLKINVLFWQFLFNFALVTAPKMCYTVAKDVFGGFL